MLDVVVDQLLRAVLLGVVAVPVHDLLERPAVAEPLPDGRVPDRDDPVGSMAVGEPEQGPELAGALRLPAAREPGRRQPERGGRELDVLDRGAHRREEDVGIVLEVLGGMLGSLRMREAHLPAPVAEDEQDRDGVLQVALVHRREAAGRVLPLPCLLALQDLANTVPDVGVVDAEEVPGLGVGAARRPPPRLHDRKQRLARDPSPRLELADAPAAPDDVEQGRRRIARFGRDVVPFVQRRHLPVAPGVGDAPERSPLPTAPPTRCTRRLEDARGACAASRWTTLAACTGPRLRRSGELGHDIRAPTVARCLG